jgi:hypothetical protein
MIIAVLRLIFRGKIVEVTTLTIPLLAVYYGIFAA